MHLPTLQFRSMRISRGAVLAATALVVPLIGAVLYRFDPATTGGYPPCVWKSTTGWDCPGCGSTRAAHQLMHGETAAAFRLNPVFVVGIPLVGLIWCFERWLASRTSPEAGRRRVRIWAWLLAAVGIAFGVWRNTSIYPLGGQRQVPPEEVACEVNEETF